MDELRVEEIAFEHHREPLGIGEAEQRLSWTVAPGPGDWLQTAYQVRTLDGTGAVTWTGDRVRSRWGCSTRRTGRAEFIAPELPDGPNPLLRHDFEVSGTVTAARLYVTALGVYEVELNGHRVGDEVLAPGWTSYHPASLTGRST